MVKVISVNRKALYDYDILDRLEAGILLTGTEIKSIRAGQVNLRDAFARPQKSELWLYNAHIAPYKAASPPFNHDPYRPRKLLLHRDEIARLAGNVSQKGLTVVALRLYIKDHLAKVELGLARGRRKYDKREAIAAREAQREMRRAAKVRLQEG